MSLWRCRGATPATGRWYPREVLIPYAVLTGLKDRFPDIIVDIRGKGLLIGVKLIPNNREFMAAARDQKLLVAGGGDNCVRLLPPLVLTIEEAREAIEKFEKTCEAMRAKAAAA